MARKRDRIIAGSFAALFILTSFTLTIAVVMQMVEESKNKTDPAAIESSTQQPKEKNVEDQLQGKPLAGFTPGAPIPELKTEDLTPGTGEEVKAGATVTVDYTGALAATGIVFESSKDSGQPATFPLSAVIKGWTEGIPGMKVGGTRRLHIPAELAYGASGQGSIPANSDLVFDVTLISTK
jgi:FKBP-type peptidyl-prolyl cis-trans isomerase